LDQTPVDEQVRHRIRSQMARDFHPEHHLGSVQDKAGARRSVIGKRNALEGDSDKSLDDDASE
jgi:hypothetical protein